jgi:anti-sigma factor RsiW
MLRRRITCRTVRDLLPLHCGGDLPPEKGLAVDEHLHACLACFREFREHAAMRGRLGVLAEEPLPEGALDGFTDEVMARIAVGEEGPAAALPSARGWRRFDVPAVRLAAAAALLVAIGLGAWQVSELRFNGASPAPSSAPRETLADAGLQAVPVSPAEAEVHRLPASGKASAGAVGTLVGDEPLGSGLILEPNPRAALQSMPQWRLSSGLVPDPGARLRLRDALDPR